MLCCREATVSELSPPAADGVVYSMNETVGCVHELDSAYVVVFCGGQRRQSMASIQTHLWAWGRKGLPCPVTSATRHLTQAGAGPAGTAQARGLLIAPLCVSHGNHKLLLLSLRTPPGSQAEAAAAALGNQWVSNKSCQLEVTGPHWGM